MDGGEIRKPDPLGARRGEALGLAIATQVVTVLPPSEGFSPQAVGAIGLLVNRLGAPDDLVVGQSTGSLCFSGRRFEPVSSALWPPFGRARRYLAGVSKIVARERPKIVEIHNRAALALGLARAHPTVKTILYVHNDPQGLRGAKLPDERAELLRRMQVVCVSEHLRQRFTAGLPPGAGSPAVLPNAIDWTELPPALPRHARDRVILFVGRVVADKGADAFVRACGVVLDQLPGWRAEIIGADRALADAKITPFERALHPRAASSRVEMRGYLPHAQVLEAMSRAAIVAVPSRWAEPFGMTALEAMACGAALLCSGTGGLREVAGEAALYAPPDPPGALEAGILALATDEERRIALSEAGLARARSFDAPAARARLAALRREVLHSA